MEEHEWELRHEKQLMSYYSTNDSLQDRRRTVKQRCEAEETGLKG